MAEQSPSQKQPYHQPQTAVASQIAKQPWRKPSIVYIALLSTAAEGASGFDGDSAGPSSTSSST